jgi:acetyltransferase-like isoleucine patch superfamily enzyme
MLDAYRLGKRARDRAFAAAIRGSFAEFGNGTRLCLPVQVWGESRIRLGENVTVGEDSWLHALGPSGRITIGSDSSMSGHLVISAIQEITLGRRVLIARGVYIADHNHRRDDMNTAIADQGLADVSPVEIGDGAWLGQNVVVLPGARIGAGAVIGANAVVMSEVPAHAVAVGAPARVVGRT